MIAMALINFCSHVRLYQFIYYDSNQSSCSIVLIFKFTEFSEACALMLRKTRHPGCESLIPSISSFFRKVQLGIHMDHSVSFQINMCCVRWHYLEWHHLLMLLAFWEVNVCLFLCACTRIQHDTYFIIKSCCSAHHNIWSSPTVTSTW